MALATGPTVATITFSESAMRVPCSVNHLRHLHHTGQLPFPVLDLGPRVLRIPVAPFEAWLRGERNGARLPLDRSQRLRGAGAPVVTAAREPEVELGSPYTALTLPILTSTLARR